MKRKLLLALCLCGLTLGIQHTALAQTARRYGNQAPDRNTVIKINPLSLFALTGSAFIEHAVTPNISVQLGGFVTGVEISDVKFNGYGITPEVRYYFSEAKEAPAGPYVGGYGRILNYKLRVQDTDANTEYRATYAPIGVGAVVGNQWIFNSGFSLDVYVGGGFNGGKLEVNTGTEDDFDLGFLNLIGNGLRIRPGLTVGYSF